MANSLLLDLIQDVIFCQVFPNKIDRLAQFIILIFLRDSILHTECKRPPTIIIGSIKWAVKQKECNNFKKYL